MVSFGPRRSYSIGYLGFFILLPFSPVGAQTESTLLVDKSTCLHLTETVTPVGGADYVAGLDAYGKPVIPAEGPSSGSWNSSLADDIPIDLSVDLGARTGLGDEGKVFLGEVIIGRVTVKDGKVMIGGKPVGDPELEAIRQACRRLRIE